MRHAPEDLKQLQSIPLDYKIYLTKQRIETWHDSWVKFTISDKETGKTRFVTADTRDRFYRPPLKPSEHIEKEEPGQVYVSFSGGKDSTVLKHIVDSMYEDVPSLFVNTGLEYPEIQKFAMSQKNVVTVRPEMRFDEVLKKYGYPVISKRVAGYVATAKRNPDSKRAKWIRGEEWTKFVTGGKYAYLIDSPFLVSSRCCDVMKKAPAKNFGKQTGRKAILATMASESLNRKHHWITYGCNAFDCKDPISTPMAFWTEQDVLQYIRQYEIPYCSVYGEIRPKQEAKKRKSAKSESSDLDDFLASEPSVPLETTGCSRTGCIFCCFGCTREKEPNRFQRLKETHPRQYDYCIGGGEWVDGKWQPSKEGLGLGYVLDYIGVKYD